MLSRGECTHASWQAIKKKKKKGKPQLLLSMKPLSCDPISPKLLHCCSPRMINSQGGKSLLTPFKSRPLQISAVYAMKYSKTPHCRSHQSEASVFFYQCS